MSAKAVREVDGKGIIGRFIEEYGTTHTAPFRAVQITKDTDVVALPKEHPWLLTEKLVAKPDQLIKRRGKLGLVKVNTDYEGCLNWINERMGKPIKIGACEGLLKTFIIEPFVAHQQEDEYYVSIYGGREGNTILFYHEGGVDVGDVDAKAEALVIPIDNSLTVDDVTRLVAKLPLERQAVITEFLISLYNLFVGLYFTYLEINPLVVVDGKIYILDLAAKLDETAGFEVGTMWGEIEFPAPFGRESFPEEKYIAELDSKSGASLKLTILNPKGRIWTMVAGGGASVIYADTICDLGGRDELANYGEYSGAPSETQTYEYAKTLLSLMTREPDAQGRSKLLIIGGGIANFTNVAATFKGLIRALREYDDRLKAVGAKIFVRRAGPNYQEGLRLMRELDREMSVPIEVYGPETHMTAICAMALGLSESDPEAAFKDADFGRGLGDTYGAVPAGTPSSQKSTEATDSPADTVIDGTKVVRSPETEMASSDVLFTKTTTCIVYGMQPRAVQGMLDFDHMCGRETPSVSAMIYPFGGYHTMKFYWGTSEMLVPVYPNIASALAKYPNVDVMINFSSFRSAFDTTMEAMECPQIKTIAIIAEGIPENRTRRINITAKQKKVTIIGPATVGGIKPGCFRIGNTGGMMDNVISSCLYRPGSVAYVSRSGGMSNELNNIMARNTDGVYEGVAIGGDRYPGTTFMDHIMRYERNLDCKMIVLLGEVGGVEEYGLAEAIKAGQVTKPVVAWCIGTCASMFTSEVQFGHAGSMANENRETALAKNEALREAGANVPSSFDTFGQMIKTVYEDLIKQKVIVPKPEPPRPSIPIDYAWAQELGLIRKPTSFVSTISDERGQELTYAGVPISEVLRSNMGIGGVMGLLWFKRTLPPYAARFIEMCVMIVADHGPAVSGAHNTIVTARAGKDLVSSLCSGLLTIGDRFGGALDGAAKQFSEAFDKGLSPKEFVNYMRNKKELIMGIGHRVKSINNPDRRVVCVIDYVRKTFPKTPLLDYAMEVEKITTSKKPNLILNVDGAIGIVFVDFMRESGLFTKEEAKEYIEIGTLNGLFVFGRTLGFIGHFLDQKRLKQ
eukprot:Ihof_evm20s15 gene=Ihof_evmTU20s15